MADLILVDEQDRAIGAREKVACHLGQGVLHRAFSVFVFNARGELLLQQRSSKKMLWSGYWSNSCCSHPRVGQQVEQAAKVRLMEELGFSCEVNFIYKFQYQASFGAIGSEHELCHVLVGRSDAQVKPNPDEVSAIRWCSPAGLDEQIKTDSSQLTPWFVQEWQTLRQQHWPEVLRLSGLAQ